MILCRLSYCLYELGLLHMNPCVTRIMKSTWELVDFLLNGHEHLTLWNSIQDLAILLLFFC